MQCPKCNKNVPDDAVFCCYCGRRLAVRERKAKKRPNGTSCIYKLGGNRAKPWGIKKNGIFLGAYTTKALAIKPWKSYKRNLFQNPITLR